MRATMNKSIIPNSWFNAIADYPELFEPYMDSETYEFLEADDLKRVFTPSLIEQDLNTRQRTIRIPDELMQFYKLWRPTPLIRACNLERYLDTQCRIFFKYEGVSPIGSHKANSAIAQAYYCQKDGVKEVVAETGAGQWGSAISMASSFFNLRCKVFMVKNSYESKPARRTMMQTFGSEVVSSPSKETDVGREVLRNSPDFSGSLGVAIGEAIEYASKDDSTVYTMGSAFNFVCLHQTIIGNELKRQLEQQDIRADHIISCIGGGSSFAGISLPFLDKRKNSIDLVAVESDAVPSVTQGVLAYDYGDSAELTPLAKMYTLGHKFAPPGIHAGGLRYHGLSPIVSKMVASGYARAEAYSQLEIFKAASIFAKCEGYIPAPEAAHSVKSAIETALKFRREKRNIIFCMTGHGFFDLAGYHLFNSGKMEDSSIPSEAINKSISDVRDLNQAISSPATKPVNTYPDHQQPNTFNAWWTRNFENTGSVPPSRSGNSAVSDDGLPGDGFNRKENTNYNILTQAMVQEALQNRRTEIRISDTCVVTPLAMELVKQHNISLNTH